MTSAPNPTETRAPRTATRTHILAVDDEPAVATLLDRVLTHAGFQVTQAGTGAQALEKAHSLDPDLILLDLMLPDMRGEDVLTELVAHRPGRRVIVLTAATQIATRVAVLGSGAADYLAKPFANSELLARVRARMRDPLCSPEQVRLADSAGRGGRPVELDVRRRVVVIGGHHIALTSKEFFLLSHMLQRAPDHCTRDELLAAVWGANFHSQGGGNLVEVHISRLRFKLAPTKIEMVRNLGYRLVTE